MVKKAIITVLLCLFPVLAFCDWIFNPYTGKSDYYQNTTNINSTGNITAPFFIGNGSLLTGLSGTYSSSTAQSDVGWKHLGTTVILNTTSNNVGIGTPAPVSLLHVYGIQNDTGGNYAMKVGPLVVANSLNNYDTPGVKTIFSFFREGKVGTTYASTANFNIGRYSQAAGSEARTQLNLRLANGMSNDPNIDVMSWQANGNVGIGTTSPVAKLEVINTADQTAFRVQGNPTQTAPLVYVANDTNTGVFAIKNNGNVGIGTTAPSQKLDVAGTINATAMNIGANAVLTAASNLNASLINAGTIPAANLGMIYNTSIFNLSATQLTGTVPGAQLGVIAIANGGTGSGTGSAAGLTSLNASNITAGTIPAANLGLIYDASINSMAATKLTGTVPGAQLGVIAIANGGTGSGTGSAAALVNIPAANITGLSTTTFPLMRLNILNITSGTIPGSTLSIQKNYTIDNFMGQNIGGTNCIINMREVDSTGTTPLYTLMAGKTLTSTKLTITSFTGGTCPANNLIVFDVVSVSGTITSTRLEIHGHEY